MLEPYTSECHIQKARQPEGKLVDSPAAQLCTLPSQTAGAGSKYPQADAKDCSCKEHSDKRQVQQHRDTWQGAVTLQSKERGLT